jgi:phosphoglycolate phosphatase-like HAD superfamily hydrolase
MQSYLARLPECLHARPGQVMPGIAELLDHLNRMDDLLIGLLTGNVRDGARLKLHHYGLFDYFRCGGFGDLHFERDHVAHEALTNVQRHLGGPVQPDRVWVIGDTPLDVQCARAIGARVAAVASGWHSLDELAAAGPDLLFADLADATPLLERLANGVAVEP